MLIYTMISRKNIIKPIVIGVMFTNLAIDCMGAHHLPWRFAPGLTGCASQADRKVMRPQHSLEFFSCHLDDNWDICREDWEITA